MRDSEMGHAFAFLLGHSLPQYKERYFFGYIMLFT